mgnify:CR=1 FL=1
MAFPLTVSNFPLTLLAAVAGFGGEQGPIDGWSFLGAFNVSVGMLMMKHFSLVLNEYWRCS